MGIGQGELMIIFLVVLLLFGAKKLPELAKGIGKAMGEFKTAQREFQDEMRRAEYTLKADERRQAYSQARPETPASTTATPAPAPAAETAKTEEPAKAENTDQPA